MMDRNETLGRDYPTYQKVVVRYFGLRPGRSWLDAFTSLGTVCGFLLRRAIDTRKYISF